MSVDVAIEPLAREFERNGRVFVQMFRSHREGHGGTAIYMQNSLPGEATGHLCHLFKIEIENGRETVGESLSVHRSVDAPMIEDARIAGQAQ
jgi:hypothetical protein